MDSDYKYSYFHKNYGIIFLHKPIFLDIKCRTMSLVRACYAKIFFSAGNYFKNMYQYMYMYSSL